MGWECLQPAPTRIVSWQIAAWYGDRPDWGIPILVLQAFIYMPPTPSTRAIRWLQATVLLHAYKQKSPEGNRGGQRRPALRGGCAVLPACEFPDYSDRTQLILPRMNGLCWSADLMHLARCNCLHFKRNARHLRPKPAASDLRVPQSISRRPGEQT